MVLFSFGLCYPCDWFFCMSLFFCCFLFGPCNIPDYTKLMTHVKKEFAMENLLFVTIVLQVQDFLIENGYWHRMKTVNGLKDIPYACYHFTPIKLPNTIPLSPIVSRLKSNMPKKNSMFCILIMIVCQRLNLFVCLFVCFLHDTHKKERRRSKRTKSLSKAISPRPHLKLADRVHSASPESVSTNPNTNGKSNCQQLKLDLLRTTSADTSDDDFDSPTVPLSTPVGKTTETPITIGTTSPISDTDGAGSDGEAKVKVNINLRKGISYSSNININRNRAVSENNSINIRNNYNSANFGQFCLVFVDLYQQYIEPGRAPFEINISSKMRGKMTDYYSKMMNQAVNTPSSNCNDNYTIQVRQMRQMNSNQSLDELTFIQLWNDLVIVCDEVCENLMASIGRCSFD